MSGAALCCRICESTHALAPLSICPVCAGPLDVHYAWADTPTMLSDRRSMWRYGAFLPHGADAALPGRTPLVHAQRLSDALGIDLHLKLESANPTHSFKDRLAATAVAAARAGAMETICCASGPNLGSAVAAACAAAGLEAVVLTPTDGEPAAVAASYGARVFTVRGTYEDCRRLERELEHLFPWGFLEGNLHAFSVEGVKTISYEIAEQLAWEPPDAVVSPLASGTLLAKLAQGFAELAGLGLMNGSQPPRQFGAQPSGCQPIATAWSDERPLSRVIPNTVARSLAVGDPVYGDLALGAARMSGGSILAVPEDRIAPSTELLAEHSGVHADAAGGVAFAALLDLVQSGTIAEGARVVIVVTGSGVKPDPDAAYAAKEIEADAEGFLDAVGLSRD